MIGVYVHIPFCRTRCPYCDFLSQSTPDSVPSVFTDALVDEIAAYNGPVDAQSVFLGGGTPSLLTGDALARILKALRRRFRFEQPEISIEANPDDVTPVLADAWRDLGINRVSLGVQSFDDAVLRYLGRRHDAATAHRACDTVAARFDNWGLDLIFGAPPTLAWDDTLTAALGHGPSHISAYGLTYEPATPFAQRATDAVDDAAWLELYRRADERLATYDHYEISNFALPEHRCVHNLIYWRNEAYAGFGPGAYSFHGAVRSRNTSDLAPYLDDPLAKDEAITLAPSEVRLETVIQHLRLRDGLPKPYYAQRFGQDVHDDFGEALDVLEQRGLIEDNAQSVRPTPAGFELNNEIGLALV